eukprot:2277472-Pyramimonas_sp.AAC.1
MLGQRSSCNEGPVDETELGHASPTENMWSVLSKAYADNDMWAKHMFDLISNGTSTSPSIQATCAWRGLGDGVAHGY